MTRASCVVVVDLPQSRASFCRTAPAVAHHQECKYVPYGGSMSSAYSTRKLLHSRDCEAPKRRICTWRGWPIGKIRSDVTQRRSLSTAYGDLCTLRSALGSKCQPSFLATMERRKWVCYSPKDRVLASILALRRNSSFVRAAPK